MGGNGAPRRGKRGIGDGRRWGWHRLGAVGDTGGATGGRVPPPVSLVLRKGETAFYVWGERGKGRGNAKVREGPPASRTAHTVTRSAALLKNLRRSRRIWTDEVQKGEDGVGLLGAGPAVPNFSIFLVCNGPPNHKLRATGQPRCQNAAVGQSTFQHSPPPN